MSYNLVENGKLKNIAGGSGGDIGIEVTQAEYDALKEAGELKADTNYFVKDAEGGGSSTIKASYTLLWENPSPSAITFGEQSIEIEDIKNHNLFVIVWKNDSTEDQAVVMPEYYFTMNALAISSNYNCYRTGKIDKENKTLNFQRGVVNNQYYDAAAIPLAFYGIK